MKFTKNLLLFFLLTILASIYLRIALGHSNRVNTSFESDEWGDQFAHIETIKKTHKENFTYLGDRNRMPLYDFIQAAFYTPGMSDKILFNQAKIINIILSIALVFLVYFVSLKFLARTNSFVLSIIIGFALFLPKAAYVQPEILYYTLSSIAFLFFCKTIIFNKSSDAILAGVFAALSYLSKATMLLGFGLFTGFQLLVAVKSIVQFIFKNTPKPENTRKVIAATSFSVISFLLLLSPYLLQNKDLYGKYFYNQSMNFLWYQSWGEYLNTPEPKEPPTLKSYFTTHTPGQAFLKIKQGIILHINLFLYSYASIPGLLLFIYIIFLPYAILSRSDNRGLILRLLEKHFRLLFFALVYFTVYLFAFLWYASVGAGPRFVLSLYIPVISSMFFIMDKINHKKLSFPYYKIKPLSRLGLKRDHLKIKSLYVFHFLILVFLGVVLKITLWPILFSEWAGN